MMQTYVFKTEIVSITHMTFINNMIGNIMSTGNYWRPVKFLWKSEQFLIGCVDHNSDRPTPVF